MIKMGPTKVTSIGISNFKLQIVLLTMFDFILVYSGRAKNKGVDRE